MTRSNTDEPRRHYVKCSEPTKAQILYYFFTYEAPRVEKSTYTQKIEAWCLESGREADGELV